MEEERKKFESNNQLNHDSEDYNEKIRRECR